MKSRKSSPARVRAGTLGKSTLEKGRFLWEVRHSARVASLLVSLPKGVKPLMRKWLRGEKIYLDGSKAFGSLPEGSKARKKARRMAEVVLATHPTWERRDFAIRVLGEIGTPESIPALRKALDDPMSNVRKNAGAYLKRIIGRLEDEIAFKTRPKRNL